MKPERGGVIERERVTHTTDQGDHDRFAHYIIDKDPGAAITESIGWTEFDVVGIDIL